MQYGTLKIAGYGETIECMLKYPFQHVRFHSAGFTGLYPSTGERSDLITENQNRVQK